MDRRRGHGHNMGAAAGFHREAGKELDMWLLLGILLLLLLFGGGAYVLTSNLILVVVVVLVLMAISGYFGRGRRR